jgi:CheY-like chemotaxis protein
MKNARVLIVDDDVQWIKTFSLVLSKEVASITSATTVDEAIGLLDTHYFNVAIVDLRLAPKNSPDETGMRFLRAVQERGLEDVIAPIMCTGYGNQDSAIEALRDFKVVDFLPKKHFPAQRLQSAVVKALERNECRSNLQIEIEGGPPLVSLWEYHDWAQREDAAELAAELHDLLRRLYRQADRLWMRPLTAGQSGAGVLQVEPTYGATVGELDVVKFGKRDKILTERKNYDDYIDFYISSQSSTQVKSTSGRVMGALRYRFIGSGINQMDSFASFYARQTDAEPIKQVLDHLFKYTCQRWYDNRQQPRRQRNLVELYVDGLHIRWDEVWAGARRSGVDLSGPTLHFPGMSEELPNPQQWLEQINYLVSMPVWLAITHGDMNEHNILVTHDRRCWLIDFYRSGLNHILRDLAELETAIKFNLTALADSGQRAAFERLLLAQPALDAPVAFETTAPYAKAAAVVFHLRLLVAELLGFNRDSGEYYVALLLQTLNMLRLDFLHGEHGEMSRRQVLLSAALICQRLQTA